MAKPADEVDLIIDVSEDSMTQAIEAVIAYFEKNSTTVSHTFARDLVAIVLANSDFSIRTKVTKRELRRLKRLSKKQAQKKA